MSEELLLKWNDHHSLFFVGAEELCEGEEYTDVTLAAGTKFFPAHKLVLSICSPYFRQLFKHLGQDKPVIFLKDVDPEHLHLLLQYMYKGEIKVQESELVHVLSTAQALEVKGLSDQTGSNAKGHLANSPKITQSLPIDPGYEKNMIPTPIKKKQPLTTSRAMSDIKGPIPSTSQPVYGHGQVPVKQEIQIVTQEQVHNRIEQLEDGKSGYDDDIAVIETVDGLEQDMEYVDTSVVPDYGHTEHYEEAIEELNHQDAGWTVTGNPTNTGNVVCNYCGKEYRQMSALKTHLPVHTGEKRFECKGCGRRFTQISSLNKHMKIKHCSPQLNQNWTDS